MSNPTPSVLGFPREDLEAIASGLDGYDKTVNVGNTTGAGDELLESTTAAAARFIRASLAAADAAASPAGSWPIRGVRVDGDSVIVLAKGGNDAARWLCGALLALREAKPPLGLPLAQEPKYTVNGAAIVTRASGAPIPADEPVFIFRARDVNALHALKYYAVQCGETSHSLAVMDRIDEFERFAAEHPERMKVPDTAQPRMLAPHPAWPFPTGRNGGSDAAH